MMVATTARVFFLAFLLAILVGGVVLQVWLSKKESKWPGLILPLITFAIALVVTLNMVVFVEFVVLAETQFADGELVTTMMPEESIREEIPGAIGNVIYMFLLMNIPTAILLIIYASFRGKRNRQSALEKMSIQDLE